jgi:hypothetical protein
VSDDPPRPRRGRAAGRDPEEVAVPGGWSLGRIVSGRRRLVHRADPALDPRSVAGAGRPEGGPPACRCPACGGRLRYAQRRERPQGAADWTVDLRCPDCGACERTLLPPGELDELERADEAAEAAVAADLMLVAELRRRHDVELLIACLREGLILPEDF